MISIETKEGVIEVISPYNPEFVDFAHMRGGKWSDEKQVWMFDKRDEFAVRSALIDIYGTDNYKSCEKVDVRCDFDVVNNNIWKAYLGGWEVAKNKYGEVRLSDRTVLVEGKLVTYNNKVRGKKYQENIIEVRAIPKKAAEKVYNNNPKKVEIIGGIDRQKLLDEKQKLQERIEKIDELLETMEEERKEDEIIADLQD